MVHRQHALYLQPKDTGARYVTYNFAGMIAAKAGTYKEFPIVYESGPGDVPTGQRAFLGIINPAGIGADSVGAATQVGVWQDADTLKSSTRLVQDANGLLTVGGVDTV